MYHNKINKSSPVAFSNYCSDITVPLWHHIVNDRCDNDLSLDVDICEGDVTMDAEL